MTVMYDLVKLEYAVIDFLRDLEAGGEHLDYHKKKLARLTKYKLEHH